MLAISLLLLTAQSVPDLVERARTGGCDAARAGLAAAFRESPKSEDKRLAGVALAQCEIASEHYSEAWPIVEALRAANPADADVLYLAAKLHLRGWNDVVYQMFQKTPSSFRVNQVIGGNLRSAGALCRSRS